MDAFFLCCHPERSSEGSAFSSHLHESGALSLCCAKVENTSHPTLAAGRRNNSVHPQIHHHLSVVVHGVRNAERS